MFGWLKLVVSCLPCVSSTASRVLNWTADILKYTWTELESLQLFYHLEKHDFKWDGSSIYIYFFNCEEENRPEKWSFALDSSFLSQIVNMH